VLCVTPNLNHQYLLKKMYFVILMRSIKKKAFFLHSTHHYYKVIILKLQLQPQLIKQKICITDLEIHYSPYQELQESKSLEYLLEEDSHLICKWTQLSKVEA